jgi:hypothetical protein
MRSLGKWIKLTLNCPPAWFLSETTQLQYFFYEGLDQNRLEKFTFGLYLSNTESFLTGRMKCPDVRETCKW